MINVYPTQRLIIGIQLDKSSCDDVKQLGAITIKRLEKVVRWALKTVKIEELFIFYH
jgi:hypothetical protein